MDTSVALFSISLAAGIAGSLAVTGFRDVPSGYFRTCLLIALGLVVLAILAGWRTWDTGPRGLVIAGGVVAYLGFSAWHIERRTAGALLAVVVGALLAVAVALVSLSPSDASILTPLASALVGALFVGSGLAGMLLGHYYLTAPWMTLAPLQRMTGAILVLGLARAAVSFAGVRQLALDAYAGPAHSALSLSEAGLYLGVRVVVGIVAPIVLAILTAQTIRLKATQAATGILYVIVICTLIGEVSAVALRGATGVAQ